MRIEQLEKHTASHSDSLKRCFERLEILENKPARTALQAWAQVGSIAISIIATAIITFLLVYLGLMK
jgi:hypothetical protein